MFCHQCGRSIPASGNFCPSCGAQAASVEGRITPQSPRQTTPVPTHQPSAEAGAVLPFHTGKLVIGIICLILSMWILFQACAVGILNNLDQTGDVGGSAGVLVVLLWWVAGIIGIAGRKSRKATGTAAACYILAAFIGFGNSSVFKDLMLYGLASLGFGIAFAWSAYCGEKKSY